MRFCLHPLLAGITALALGLLASGCNHFARRTPDPTFGNRVAIALTVNGTGQPSPSQWAALTAAIQPQLVPYGLVLVDDLAQADRILRIDFTPSIIDPDTSGRATVLGWRANPLHGYAYSSGLSFPSASYTSGITAYNNSTYGYDRYPNGDYSPSYAGGSAGGSTTVTTPVPTKPNHPGYRHDDRPPGQRNPSGHRHADRTPGTTPPASGDHGRYAGGNHPTNPDRGSHPRPAPSTSPPTYASSSGSSSSSSASSYSSSSGSSGSYSSSSSSSTYSSGSSSGSGSPSSASSGSGSSSSGSSLSRDSSTQKHQN